MNFPDNLLYTLDHEWIEFVDDIAFVGVTDFAQKELGDIVYVEIETLGSRLKQNEVFGTIEAVKTVSDLFLPIDGEVIEINSEIISAPELVNNSAYEKGWLIKIMPSETDNKTNLLTKNQYLEHIGL